MGIVVLICFLTPNPTFWPLFSPLSCAQQTWSQYSWPSCVVLKCRSHFFWLVNESVSLAQSCKLLKNANSTCISPKRTMSRVSASKQKIRSITHPFKKSPTKKHEAAHRFFWLKILVTISGIEAQKEKNFDRNVFDCISRIRPFEQTNLALEIDLLSLSIGLEHWLVELDCLVLLLLVCSQKGHYLIFVPIQKHTRPYINWNKVLAVWQENWRKEISSRKLSKYTRNARINTK